MALVTYNSITLPYAFITNLGQNAVSDPESNTDWYLLNFDISAQFVLNAVYLSQIAPGLGSGFNETTPPAVLIKALRSKLMQRRKALSVTFNGKELIPQAQPGLPGTTDAANGPIPLSCNIIELENATFILDYRITASYWENNKISSGSPGNPTITNQAGNSVLYNRWTETVTIDDCNYSTRTRNGKFVIRSDNAEGLVADQIRAQMAVVSCPPGFLRENSTYTIDPNGLGISYSITDREVYRKPPSPAFTASGYYREQSDKGGGHRYGTCRISLKGSKTTDQAALIKAAVSTAWTKIAYNAQRFTSNTTPQGVPSFLVVGASLLVQMYENQVDFSLEVMFQGVTQRLQGLADFTTINTIVPGSDGVDYTPAYRIRGSASLLIQAAAYYDPSLADTQIGAGVLTVADNPQVDVGSNQVQLTNGTEVGLGGAEVG